MQNENRRFMRLPYEYGRDFNGYRIVKCIGQGGYGDVYYVIRISDNLPFAMKIEKKAAHKQALESEEICLQELKNDVHFPQTYYIGEDETCRYAVIDLLGPSFSDLSKLFRNRRFSTPTILRIAIQMLEAVWALHEHGYIHNDIKPHNFLIRFGSPTFVVLIDFGFSEKYRNSDGSHVYRGSREKCVGTIMYGSPRFSDHSIMMSRRDDLYSWLYTVLALHCGRLPWKDIEKPSKMARAKRRVTQTPQFLELPECFIQIWEHIHSLHYADDPDYEMMISLMKETYVMMGYGEDTPFDWEQITDEMSKIISVYPISQAGKNLHTMPFTEAELIDAEVMKKAKEKAKNRARNQPKKRRTNNKSVCCNVF